MSGRPATERFRPCVVVPTYDNPATLRGVIEGAREHLPEVIVVDDGSGPEGRAACEALAAEGLARVHHRERNGGKGAAVKTGLRLARELGFTHALQIDGDGQHDPAQIPELLEIGATRPEALVLGYPQYDASAPWHRRIARPLTRFWVDREAGRGVIRDAMVGFRLYPLEPATAARIRHDRMAFDIESAVRLARGGVPVINHPVRVRYLDASEGGRSHFRMVRDNLAFCALHSRLCTEGILGWFLRVLRLRRPRRLPGPGGHAALEAPDDGSKPPDDAGDAPATNWLTTRERGTVVGIRAIFALATLAGRRVTRGLMALIALYYATLDRGVVRASRQWLRTVRGRRPRWRDVYGHVRRFANVALDRIFLLKGRTRPFAFNRTGHEHLARLVDQRRGAVLLGAHLGSYEAMRAGGMSEGVPINIVGYFDKHRMLNALFEELNPEATARLIPIEDGSVDFIFRVRERVEAGELVALLGDRVGRGERTVDAEFFGATARFPAGPFLLASALRCPVLLVFGLYFEPNRYELYCEPFVERVDLPRGRRDEALQEHVQRYAHRLEDYCRAAPDNWFNFYDFWRAA